MSKWIPATHHPTEDGLYLAYSLRDGIKILEWAYPVGLLGKRVANERSWFEEDVVMMSRNYAIRDVTHWMPLPEPPK